MSRTLNSLRYRLFILLFLAFSKLLLAAPVTVDPLAGKMDLSDSLSLIRDPERRLSFKEALDQSDLFIPVTRQELVTSFNPGAFWLKVTLRNDTRQKLSRWLAAGSAKTQRVTLYQHQESGWQIQQSGRSVAVLDKPIVTREPVFPIDMEPGQALDLILQIDSRGATDMATTLWDPKAYHQAASRFLIRESALLGGLLVGSALSLILFARLRQAQYLWFGLLLMSVCGLEANRENLFGTLLWPGHLPLPPQSLSLFAVTALFSLAKVVDHALELKLRIPLAHRLLIALRWIAVCCALLSIFSYGHGVRLLSLTTLVLHVTTLLLSVMIWRRGHKAGRIFLLAFTLGLLTETLRQLANQGLIPWIAAMDFSMFLFLLASPLILLGLAEQTHQLTLKLHDAERLQQAKSDFFARINHELRSPLNTILGYSRMLNRGTGKLNLEEGTKGIETSTLRLLDLIDELLDEARAAAGQLQIAPGPMRLRPWLNEIVQTVRMAVEGKGNRLVCNLSGELPEMIIADGKRLRQVLENLLGNANRHTEQGIITFNCAAQVSGENAMLEFSVQDTGEGIDPERLKVIFEPFVRGLSRSSGHGLGLSICRELVCQMGSDIRVSSALGEGSCFSFNLLCPVITKAVPTQSQTTASTALSNIHPTALLVDDDALVLESLAELLTAAGIEVQTAASGKAALVLLARQHWAVIVTDQMMAGIDGWAVLRQARSMTPSPPVILHSATHLSRPGDFPANMEFDAYLPKPAGTAEILASVWFEILRPTLERLPLDWGELTQLAKDGDISGIEEWITVLRNTHPDNDNLPSWLETQLYRLNLGIVQGVSQKIEEYLARRDD